MQSNAIRTQSWRRVDPEVEARFALLRLVLANGHLVVDSSSDRVEWDFRASKSQPHSFLASGTSAITNGGRRAGPTRVSLARTRDRRRWLVRQHLSREHPPFPC